MISDFLFRKMTELSNFWKCKSHQDSMNEVYSLLTSEHTLTIIIQHQQNKRKDRGGGKEGAGERKKKRK